ncbi:MAG: hypothetical protein IPK82_23790 [Polyangiaceae bacterium]|nr:hypothetical protein [Polyangiaceae bacterium]
MSTKRFPFPVTKGTDPDGNQVKVQCTSVGSNYDGTAYDSGLGSGGVTVTPSFTWTTAGTKTVYCTTFDQNGAASSTPSKTITINSVNNPPTAPTISLPASGNVNQAISVSVTKGTDPDGNQVKVQCTSVGSNYDGTAYDSGLGSGGVTVTPSFTWTTAGTKAVYCTTFDQNGAASSTPSKTITINSVNNPPTAPTISLPASGNVNQAISVSVTKGTDPDGNQVKVQCTSVGSNYDGTAYDSGLGSGGVTVTPSFTWTTTGTKTVYCTTFDQNGAASSTPSKTITINSTAPSVTSVSPLTATFNQLKTFTIFGSNLPSTTVAFIPDCQGSTATTGTSTQRTFSCTPINTTGPKNGVVKDQTGGTTLFNFTVVVQ